VTPPDSAPEAARRASEVDADRPGPPRRDWDAGTYDRVAAPQEEWGREVLGRLPLRGDETVLDAGCGTGRVTRLLAERLPRGRVVAVDASPEMVERARAALPDALVLVADLTELELGERVDAVFSSAVFHWISDHDALFQRLFEALRPGGRLAAQCGGEGNIAAFLDQVHELSDTPPFRDFVGGWRGNWRFSSPAATAGALTRAGFEDVNCRLEPRSARLEEPRDFLSSVCLGAHLERLPEELHEPFVDAMLRRLPSPVTLDYVRLDIDARRP
jgi:trans-aconitate 2-methyltransferase